MYFIDCWPADPVLSWSKTKGDPRSLCYRTHLHEHMYFQFWCNYGFSCIKDCIIQRRFLCFSFLQNSTYLNMLTITCLMSDFSRSVNQRQLTWAETNVPFLSLVVCFPVGHDPYRDLHVKETQYSCIEIISFQKV